MSERLTAFLAALPYAQDEEFVNAPGLGSFRARHIRRGLERGVLAEHSTGMGLTLVQPSSHGVCGYCKGARGTQPCEHCACSLCSWFRQSEERASPRVSQEKLQQLARQLQRFQVGSAGPKATEAALDDEI
jgi:hypothetical protein